MKKLVNPLIFLSSSILSLFLLEFLIRIILPVHDPSGMLEFYHNQDGVPLARENSISRQWRNSGDYDVTVQINQYGFRDTKDLRMSTANDLFVVGDSFSFGYGVEEAERYSSLLETKLAVPIYNISIPTDIDGYEKLIAYAQEKGAIINNLIIGISMENDLVNYRLDGSPQYNVNATSSNRGVSGDNASSHEQTGTAYKSELLLRTFSSLKYFLFTHSATYNAMISTIYNTDFLREIAIQLGVTDRPDLTVQKSIYSHEMLQSSVARLIQLQKNRNIPVVTLVIIPSRALWVGSNQEVEGQVHAEFVALLQEAGFTVIDLRPAFEADGQPMDYFFKVDGHWNVKGHQKAADIIYDYLRGD